jgi:selenocysteine lyase/cysteine desulfurase
MPANVSRRRLLLGGAGVGAAGAGTLVTAGDAAQPSGRFGRSVEAGTRAEGWASVRAQFALTPDAVHLDTFVLAAHPAPVRDAVERHRRGLDADPAGYLHDHQEECEQRVRGAAAQYLGASEDHIAFTDSTTMGLGLLYGGLRLRPGDEVLTTEHDFYATHEALRLRSERDGVTVRRVALYDEPERADPGEIVSRLRAAITPRTRVVAVTWVHSGTGVKLPLAAVASAVTESSVGRDRVLLCVDGVHGFGAEETPVARLGCDFFVSGCHKWLFGPRGTGLVWGSAEAWPSFTATIPTFDGGSVPGRAATPGGYHSFEHRWALAEAFDFHGAIGGAQRIAARVRELAGALKEGLRGIDGVRVVTPASAELSAGIVCCDLAGRRPSAAIGMLRERAVHASITPYARQYVRFGPSVVNDEADVEATLRAVREIVS